MYQLPITVHCIHHITPTKMFLEETNFSKHKSHFLEILKMVERAITTTTTSINLSQKV